MISIEDVRRARVSVGPHVKRTPLERNTTLSRQLGTNIYLKLELFQRTGSFKPRGAFNQILELSTEERKNGVVGVSGGNFAQGMALAARELGMKAIVCMPESTPQNYIDATEEYGARVELAPGFPEVFARAEELHNEGWNLLHPYDNPYQMAGAGTIGIEILEDLPELTDLFVSVGGGGLFAGIATTINALKPQVRVWGVETEGSETLGEAMRAGEAVQISPRSLAKTLGAPYIAEEALRIMLRCAEQYVVVSDKEAYDAAVFLLERAKINSELAASCTLAAARRVKAAFTPHHHVVLLICGGNVSIENWDHYRKVFR